MPEESYDNIEYVEAEVLSSVENTEESTEIVPADSPPKLPHLRTLTADAKPLIPYELEDYSGDYYWTKAENKCDICKSPFRKLAEQAYLSYSKRPWRVVKFFETHYGVTVTHEGVRRHMEYHCDFKTLQKPGLAIIGASIPEVEMWIFREKQLAIMGMLQEINELKMLASDTTDKELRLRYSVQLERLYKSVDALAEKRDNASKGLKVGDFIAHIKNTLEKIKDEESKRLMIESIIEFQRMLQGLPVNK